MVNYRRFPTLGAGFSPPSARPTTRCMLLFLVAIIASGVIFLQLGPLASFQQQRYAPLYSQNSGVIEDQPELLMDINRPRILVIGAASFMGYHFVDRFYSLRNQKKSEDLLGASSQVLKSWPHLVLIDDFDNTSGDLPRKRHRQNELRRIHEATVREVPVCDEKSLTRELEMNHISLVFHAYDPVHFPTDYAMAKNQSAQSIRCFSQVLKSVRRRQLEQTKTTVVPVFYLSSSVADSAEIENINVFNTNDAIQQLVRAKKAEESLAQRYSRADGIATIGLRMFSLFGEICTHDEPLEQLWEWVSYERRKSGTVPFHSLDFIHAADAAQQLLGYIVSFLGSKSSGSSSTVDVGSGNTTSLQDLNRIFSEASNASLRSGESQFNNVAVVYDSTHKARMATNFPQQGSKGQTNSLARRIRSFIEWEEKHNFPKGIIITTYLVQLPDPQRKGKSYSSGGMPKLISNYYHSAASLGLQVYVIHDGLNMTFQQQFETPKFRFVHLDELYKNAFQSEIEEFSKFQSNNDRRYFFFYKMLKYEMQEKPRAKLPTFVLVTDLFDVHFRMNPWEYFDRYPENFLFMGQDRSLIGKGSWFIKRMQNCFFTTEQICELAVPRKPMLNPGILGGTFNVMLYYFHLMKKALQQSNPNWNCNLPVTNYVAYKYFSDRLFYGPPLHSKFMSYGKVNGDAYIIHKR
eukprot:gb/GECG01012882.1/.p1 GENE.gb/GECG01012882.1/~~gb/GECG01012882.1/.p1  ORF type:complete len:689 (+),score=63.16 gb/GECG01012882.1/:1-2067(+)